MSFKIGDFVELWWGGEGYAGCGLIVEDMTHLNTISKDTVYKVDIINPSDPGVIYIAMCYGKELRLLSRAKRRKKKT